MYGLLPLFIHFKTFQYRKILNSILHSYIPPEFFDFDFAKFHRVNSSLKIYAEKLILYIRAAPMFEQNQYIFRTHMLRPKLTSIHE